MKSLDKIGGKELAKKLRQAGQTKTFQFNESIFCEGEMAEFLPIVLKGKIKMVRFPEVGKEVIISVFGEGEMFALPPVFDGEPYPASAIAMEKSKLLLLTRQNFLQLLKDSSEFSFAVIAWMCGMLREKTSVIQNLATASPEQRIGSVLIRLAGKQHGELDTPIKIALRRQDIAEMAGLTTETTIRAARRLADKNLIKIVHGKIILEDLKVLKKFLDS
jgi:CRP/FNR family transcriptional regulator